MKVLPLYIAFAATGVAVALPGAILPALLVRWHLGDAQAGQLFFAAWVGSALGSLVVRGSLRTTLTLGSALLACAAVCIAFLDGHGANACLALYGFGLGITMTSISLTRQQQVVKAGRSTGTEMVRLNSAWAAGAVLCPALTARVLSHGSIRPLLLCLVIFFAVLAAWSALQSDMHASVVAKSLPWSALKSIPPGLVCMIFLATGVEAATGGWLSTYTRRGGDSVAATIAALTCFWAGLMASRIFWSVFDRWLTHDYVVRLSVGLMVLSSALLFRVHAGSIPAIAAFLLGFGIGPCYPLLLAWALRFQRAGSIFFIAGVGAASLPWLMGVLSARTGSLRIGFVVPIIGAVIMLTLSLLLPLRLWSREDRALEQQPIQAILPTG
jgi:fucose permease